MNLSQYLDVIVCIAAVAWLIAAILGGQRQLSSPMLWFVLGTTLFIHVGSLRDHWVGIVYQSELELRFRVLEAVHLLCVFIGFGLGGQLKVGRSSALAGASPTLAGFLVLAAVANLLKLLVANPFTQFNAELSNYTRVFGSFAYAAATLAVGVYHQTVRHLRGARWLAATTALVVVFVASAFSQSRTPIMYSLFALLMYGVWRAHAARSGSALRRVFAVYLLPAGLAGLLALGSLVKGYTAAVMTESDADTALTAAAAHGGSLQFIDAYENGLFVLESYPSPFRFRVGESVGSVLFGVVPRSMWPSKPLGFSAYMTYAKVGYARQQAGLSLATSLVGDMWGGGGWPNVIALSVAYGVILGWLTKWYQRNSESVMVKVVYWQVLFMAFLSARGDIYTIFHRAIVLILFTIIIIRVLSRRSDSVGRRAGPTGVVPA